MPKIAPFVEFDFDKALSKIACTKKEFLSFIDCKEITLYTWTKKRKYPYYVKLLLETALKVKELKDKALKSDNDLELEKLIKENETLEQEIKSYEKIEELFQKTFGFKMGEKH